MRVLLAIDGMHPRDGGPPRVVAGSALALAARGLDVAVLTTVRDGEEEMVRSTWATLGESGVELHFCPPVSAAGLFFARALPDETRSLIDGADVIHLHGLWSATLLTLARHARRTKRPYLFSIHGVLDRRAMWRTPLKWLKKRVVVALGGLPNLLNASAGVVFGSEAEAQESWDMAPGITRLFIPNGVSADIRRSPVPAQARAVVADIAPQFGSWTRSLLYFSRIHPEKGLDMLVTAFGTVAPDFPGVGLLVAGLRQDDAYQSQVEALIAASGQSSRIVLTTELTGAKSQFLHSMCDVFVLPSHAEGFSVAMIEALAHGMPCLLTQFCHAPSVESEGAGVIVPPTPQGIEGGLRRLLSLSQEELITMGARARALFEARYTWDRVAEALEKAYRAGVAGASRRG